jgi:hypothetical protein
MDAARADSEFGVAPSVYFRKKAWSLTDDSTQELSGVPRRRGLGSYGFVGMGDGATGMDILQQSLAEMPTIISSVAGRPSSAMTPYGSFSTQYSPGYGLPQAGYMAPTPGSMAVSGGILPWLVVGGIALFAFSRRR